MLALWHFLAMIRILLPFSLMVVLIEWELEIRVVVGVLVITMGVYLLINRRHLKILSLVHPARLVLWSFLAAMAHGAGLMLVPIYLGLCAVGADEAGHLAAQCPMGNTVAMAFALAVLHTISMTVAGGAIAVAIYMWLGLKFLSRTWFNLDLVWALSLILVGTIGIYSAYNGQRSPPPS